MAPLGTGDNDVGRAESLRVLDLFSGIGGFSLGLERTGGFQTVAFCEISPICRHLLAHHWPGVPCYDDITTLTAERLAADGIAVDAICGGFPCQDLSFAGKGAGLAGERSGLVRDYIRLIGELRPRVVIMENVSALLVRGLGAILGDLAALGYDAWWDCIPAAAVGAPHRRDRLWIVAYARGEQHEGFGDALRRSIASGLHEAALVNTRGEIHAGELVGGGHCAPTGGGEGLDAGQGQAPHRQRLWDQLGAGGKAVADANSGRSGRRRPGPDAESLHGGSIGSLAHADDAGRVEQWWTQPVRAQFAAAQRCGWWSSEPGIRRVADAIPARVDRLHGLGNAVVPEIPYRLGRAILEALA